MSESYLEPEFAPAYKTWQSDPSPANNDLFLHSVRPVIDAALQSYAPGNISPSLRSRAKLMTLDAASRYDPMQSKLRTHLMTQLQGLRRQTAREQQIIRIPEQLGLDRHRLLIHEQKMRDEMGRDPSDAELASNTGLSLRRLEQIRKAPSPLPETAVAMFGADEEGNPYNPAVRQGVDADRAWLEFVYYGLSPTDQNIMANTLGLFGRPKQSTNEIAKKLGVTPGAISQRAKRIQDKIDERTVLTNA